MTHRRSHLLSVEGVTGAGKSTLCRQVRRAWRGKSSLAIFGGYFARLRSPDPFHHELLTTIRKQLRRDEFLRVPWLAECLVLQAELLLAEKALVQPALADSKFVLYEHYGDSIVAYQAARLVETGAARSIRRAVNRVASLLAPLAVDAQPRATIFLEVDAVDAARRAARRDGRPLTTEARRFNELVAEAYAVLYRSKRSPVLRANSVADAVEKVLQLGD